MRAAESQHSNNAHRGCNAVLRRASAAARQYIKFCTALPYSRAAAVTAASAAARKYDTDLFLRSASAKADGTDLMRFGASAEADGTQL